MAVSVSSLERQTVEAVIALHRERKDVNCGFSGQPDPGERFFPDHRTPLLVRSRIPWRTLTS